MATKKEGVSIDAQMLEDLSRSGLTKKDAKRLSLEAISSAKVLATTEGEFGGFDRAAYKIPYWSINGRRDKYFRLRFFGDGHKKKDLRYWQPNGTLPRLYLPPLLNWQTISQDTESTLFITEGEKKAARACKDGVPCIGLGGVWSWRAAKKGVGLIDDFNAFKWKGRRVVIVFDSDLHEKHDVQHAMNSLGRALVRLGALPYVTKLPPGRDSAKVGLDDYLELRSVAELLRLPQEQLLGELGEELWRLNEELAYIEASEGIMKFKTQQLITRQTLVTVSHANRLVTIVTPEGKAQQVSAATEWLKWPHRRTHAKIAYAPGESVVTTSNAYNMWKGWGVVPQRGDLRPWRELLDYVFLSAPEHRRWFEQWLAYPLQHPGTKLYTAAVLFSLTEGVGKSLVGVTMGRIYGDNYAAISGKELHGGFNEWGANKQFVLGDDVTGSDRRADADLLKVMITRETMIVDQKYQPKYVVADLINYLFTTNQPDAFYLSNADRRYFVHEIAASPLPDNFYKRYDTWVWSEAGPAALFHYLLEEVDCAGFNPKAAAPETMAKHDMKELSRSDVDDWAHRLREAPDEALRIDGVRITRALWSTGELLLLYDPLGQRRTSAIALSKALRRAGFSAPKPVNAEGRTARLWIVDDVMTLNRAHHGELVKRWRRERPTLTKDAKVVPLRKAKF